MKKSLKKFARILLFIGLYMFNYNPIHSQDSIAMEKTNTQIVAGYHFGVVQIVGAVNKGEFTFLDKYNPDQFEILGMASSAGYNAEIVGIPFMGDKDARPLINGKNTYARVFIKNKKL